MKYKSRPFTNGPIKITKQPRRHLRFPLQCRLLNCTLLENLSDAAITKLYTLYSIYVCDEMFDYFPRFDETLRHICALQPCRQVTYSEIYPKVSKSVPILGVE